MWLLINVQGCKYYEAADCWLACQHSYCAHVPSSLQTFGDPEAFSSALTMLRVRVNFLGGGGKLRIRNWAIWEEPPPGLDKTLPPTWYIILQGWVVSKEHYFQAGHVFIIQIFHNFRRCSVEGLSFDFLGLNFTGGLAYAVFNIGLFFIPQVKVLNIVVMVPTNLAWLLL